METKKCVTCNEIKFITEFYKQTDRKNGSSKCKKCFNNYCIQRWINLKIKAIEYKGGECIDCGLNHPTQPYVIFEFHHLDPEKKDYDWNDVKKHPWSVIQNELDKCVLLCSNCHKIRHYEMVL